ncbi:conserved hypothetical protein [Catenulispora acidiphila DSM 44928]|uniref:DUF3000 domain-containing protein n=1 Tax=Catenulispora acidiphila (strain DSM 44928 / JCM 14897 / NBRC 102108 / NRRL B-24433 / ID139908) TaxID=479433 RepID=C7Q1S3_CATAD|nr:DUF3000 domain-containing protein [Catenulispora acidiphila]ACU75624.1 conserved hypothetical protein [Catenulispora acidiphila DSM 44928]
MAPSRADDPREFAEAVAALTAASPPAAVELDPLPAPVNLAPFAHAVGGGVVVGDEDLATGRLVLLHRPGGHEEWRGAWRVVVLVEADLEAEIAEDPLLAEVAWSWLMDALAEHGAPFTAEGGTVSRSSSRGFGGLSGRPATTAVEIRASWTAVPGPDGGIDFGAHLQAWCALMMMCAGLPPEYEGVANLPPAGSRR